MNVRRLYLSSIALFVTVLPLFVYAQGLVPCGDGGRAACQFCHFATLLSNITDWLIGILTIVFAIIFITAGFKLVSSQGNQAALQSAKSMILNAFIGFTIVLAAWILIDFGMKTFIGGSQAFGAWNAIRCVTQPETQVVVARRTASGLNASQFSPADAAFHATQINSSGGSCDSYNGELCSIATSRGLGAYCNVLDAQMYQESTCRVNVTSPANAHGLMQLLPGTAKGVCNSISSYDCSGMSDAEIIAQLNSDPTFNMTLGVEYFAQGLQETGGSVANTLARYNGGGRLNGNCDGAICASRDCPGRLQWECEINPGGFVETQNYVANILGTADALDDLSNSNAQ